MNESIMNAINVAATYNGNDFKKIQQEFLLLINNEKDANIKRLIIYAIDDKMISRFDNWILYLIEKQYYLTDIGGNQFFVLLKEYIQNKDYDFILICAMILKNGFCGCFQKWPEKIYNDLLHILNINKPNPEIYIPYIPHKKYNKPISLWWVLIPIILSYLLIQIIEIYIFYNTTSLIKGVTI